MPSLNAGEGATAGMSVRSLATMRGKAAAWNGAGILLTGTGILSASPVINRTLARNLVVGIMGRYFPPREARYAKHQFSRRILSAKTCDARAKPLFRPLGFGLRTLVGRFNYDLLTRIPPKPRSEYDHVGWLLQEAARRPEVALSERVDLTALECPLSYPRQRDAGSHEQRAANVAAVFRARGELRGRRILLVDDIITSGSTVASATQTLLNAGAAAVGILALAYTQNQIHRLFEPTIQCSAHGCDGTMLLQLSRKSDAGFWGCSNWQNGCKELMYFRDGLSALNALNSRETIETVPDIRF